MIHHILESLRSQRGENSIMQVIIVAVIAITVTAGLVTLPGVIVNQKNRALASSLEGLVRVQETIYTRSGSYVSTDDLKSLTTGTAGLKVSIPSGSKVEVIPAYRSTGGAGGILIVGHSIVDAYIYQSTLCKQTFFGTEEWGVLAGNPTPSDEKRFRSCMIGLPESAPSGWYTVA